MESEFTNKYLRDLKSYKKDRELIHLLGAKINEAVKSNSIEDVNGLVLIRGTTVHYRFKIKSGKIIYRIGIKHLKNTIWFACIDNNKKRFYKRFP